MFLITIFIGSSSVVFTGGFPVRGCGAAGQLASRAVDVKWQKLHVFIGYLSREMCCSLLKLFIEPFYWWLRVLWSRGGWFSWEFLTRLPHISSYPISMHIHSLTFLTLPLVLHHPSYSFLTFLQITSSFYLLPSSLSPSTSRATSLMSTFVLFPCPQWVYFTLCFVYFYHLLQKGKRPMMFLPMPLCQESISWTRRQI